MVILRPRENKRALVDSAEYLEIIESLKEQRDYYEKKADEVDLIMEELKIFETHLNEKSTSLNKIKKALMNMTNQLNCREAEIRNKEKSLLKRMQEFEKNKK